MKHPVASTTRLVGLSRRRTGSLGGVHGRRRGASGVRARALMLRWMLDTDTCSFILKRSNAAVLRRLASVPVGDAAISVVTKAELLYGIAVSMQPDRDRQAVDAFLQHVAVLEFADE